MKRLRKILKRGGKLNILSVRGDRSRKFGVLRAFIPLAVVKGKITNLSVDITNVVSVDWSDDNTIRAVSDPYHLTRMLAEALYGDGKALTVEML